MITNHLPIEVKEYRTMATKAVRAYVNRYFNGFFSEDDMKDLTSEVVTRMWKAGETYNAAKGELFTWVWTIAKNAVKDAAEAKSRKDVLTDSIDDAADRVYSLVDADEADKELLHDELVECLLDSLKQERDKRFLLWLLEGLDSKEIAEREGISPKKVYMAMYHLRERLREGVPTRWSA